MPCKICENWARADIEVKFIGDKGRPLIPNHHPHCPHYNDSLIIVYKATYNGKFCYARDEKELREIIGHLPIGLILEGIEIHKEVFDNLPEFDGF